MATKDVVFLRERRIIGLGQPQVGERRRIDARLADQLIAQGICEEERRPKSKPAATVKPETEEQ